MHIRNCFQSSQLGKTWRKRTICLASTLQSATTSLSMYNRSLILWVQCLKRVALETTSQWWANKYLPQWLASWALRTNNQAPFRYSQLKNTKHCKHKHRTSRARETTWNYKRNIRWRLLMKKRLNNLTKTSYLGANRSIWRTRGMDRNTETLKMIVIEPIF